MTRASSTSQSSFRLRAGIRTGSFGAAMVFVLLYVGLVTIRYGLALAEEEREGKLDAA